MRSISRGFNAGAGFACANLRISAHIAQKKRYFLKYLAIFPMLNLSK